MYGSWSIVLCVLIAVTLSAAAPTEPDRAGSNSTSDGSVPVNDEFVECADSLPEKCEEQLKPYFCYNYFNRQQCCASCRKLREQSDVCPYGNQPIVKWRDGRKYDCESYVARYGTKHCQHSRKFRLQCCKSCEKHGPSDQ